MSVHRMFFKKKWTLFMTLNFSQNFKMIRKMKSISQTSSTIEKVGLGSIDLTGNMKIHPVDQLSIK